MCHRPQVASSLHLRTILLLSISCFGFLSKNPKLKKSAPDSKRRGFVLQTRLVKWSTWVPILYPDAIGPGLESTCISYEVVESEFFYTFIRKIR